MHFMTNLKSVGMFLLIYQYTTAMKGLEVNWVTKQVNDLLVGLFILPFSLPRT